MYRRSAADDASIFALVGLVVGAASSTLYLLLGGDYVFSVPDWALVIFYPGFVAGNYAYGTWHLGERVCLIVGVIAVALTYALIGAVLGWLGSKIERRETLILRLE